MYSLVVLIAFLAIFLIAYLLFAAAVPALLRTLRRLSRRGTAVLMRRERFASVVRDVRSRHASILVYLPPLLLALGGAAVALLLGEAFLELAAQVREDSAAVRQADTAIHQYFAGNRTDSLTWLFFIATVIGTPVVLGAIATLVSLRLLLEKRAGWAAFVLLTSALGGLLNRLLKEIFERARPDLSEALMHAQGHSFPSGHAMGSTIVFLTVGYVLVRRSDSPAARAVAMASAVTMILLISFSRIYLGVHWITDLAGGIVAGTLWVITATFVYELARRIHMVRSMRMKEIGRS